MSGETEIQPSAWTVDSVHSRLLHLLTEMEDRNKERFAEKDRRYEQRFEAQEKAVVAALAAQEKAIMAALTAADRAVNKAELATNARFESVNEFRQALTYQTSTFIPRTEAEQRLSQIQDKLAKLDLDSKEVMSRRDYELRHKAVTDNISLILSRLDRSEAQSVGSNTGARLDSMSAQIAANSDQLLGGAGRAKGVNDSWKYLLGFASFAATIITIILVFV